jgi:hypothetical protein
VDFGVEDINCNMQALASAGNCNYATTIGRTAYFIMTFLLLLMQGGGPIWVITDSPSRSYHHVTSSLKRSR